MEKEWPLQLFNKSVLKQTKFENIISVLGPTDGLHCLDIGSDNGVISYLLRRQGGTWKSADLDERSVGAIEELVQHNVYRIDGTGTPFNDNEFDRVVLIDFLEHIPDDAGFMQELHRILKPDGVLILNAPHIKSGPLVRFRHALGLTEEEHGHLRPGYTHDSIRNLCGEYFTLKTFDTYTKSCSKLIDTLMVFVFTMLKRNKSEKKTGRGILVTGKEMRMYRAWFRAYSLIYPVVWFFAKLDALLFFETGFMLIARAHIHKGIVPVVTAPIVEGRANSETVSVQTGVIGS